MCFQTFIIGRTTYSANAPARFTPTPLRVRAQMAPPGQTIAAAPANDVPFPADDIAGMKVRHVRADFDDLSAEFVPDDQRHVNRGLRPLVPVVDVQVGAANSRAKHANLYVVDAGLGLGNVFEPQAARRADLYKAFMDFFPACVSHFDQRARSRPRATHGPPVSPPWWKRRSGPFPPWTAGRCRWTWVYGWIFPF